MSKCLSIDLMIESTGGGSMRHVMDLHDGLVHRGHDLRLIVSLRRAEPEVMDWLKQKDPDRVVRIDTARGPRPRDIWLIRRLRQTLERSGEKRLLHAHSTKAGLLSAALRPVTAGAVFTPHAYRGMDPSLSGPQRLLVRAAERGFSQRFEHVIAVSPQELDYARGLGIQAGQSSLIPNGIDIDALRGRVTTSRRDGTPRTGPVLGFVGRMSEQKNPLLFLETFAILRRDEAGNWPDLRAIMIGDGDLMAEVRARRAALGLQDVVDLRGAQDFITVMHEMDILAHTSRYESLPYVLLEAGAGGLAVIAVRNAGSEAIFGKNAPLCSPCAQCLAKATAVLLATPEMLERRRNDGLSAARQFSVEAMVDRTEAVYRHVLGPEVHRPNRAQRVKSGAEPCSPR